jgi:hypothetical protein
MRATLPALTVRDSKHGYVSGYVSYPLSAQQRNSGLVHGYEEDEWRNITRTQGGAARYPLRDNHRHDIGHLLETTVTHDAAGRSMLGVSAMVNLKSEAGQRAWADVERGHYKHFSWKFEAYEPSEAANRRYKNKLVEVSLTDDPVKDEACIVVVCSKQARLAAADADTDTSSSASYDNETQMASIAAAAATTETIPASAASATTTLASAATTAAAVAVESSISNNNNTQAPAAVGARETAQPPPPQQQQQSSIAETNGMLDFIQTSRNLSADQLVKLAADFHRQREDTVRRNAELEQQNKELTAKAEELKKIRAQEHDALVKKHRESLSVVLPALKAAGMNVDDPTQQKLIDEMVQSPYCSSLWSSMEKVALKGAEMEKTIAEQQQKADQERKHAEEERKRLNDEALRARGFLDMLQPSAETLAQVAMRSGSKRLLPTAATTVQCSNKKVMEESTASLLGLNKLDRVAFNNALATKPASMPASSPVATPSSSLSSAAAGSSAGSAEAVADIEQEPEIQLPADLYHKYDMLRNMLYNEAQGVHYPIPIACSKEEHQAINFSETHQLMAKVPGVPWEFAVWAIGSRADRDEVRRLVGKWGDYWQPFNYNKSGRRSLAGAEMEERNTQPRNTWLPPEYVF